MNDLSPEKFDRLTSSDLLRGAAAIGFELGVSEYTVQRWARDPNIPIYKPAGRFRASRAELKKWLKTKPV